MRDVAHSRLRRKTLGLKVHPLCAVPSHRAPDAAVNVAVAQVTGPVPCRASSPCCALSLTDLCYGVRYF
jgi:hypothetical protein